MREPINYITIVEHLESGRILNVDKEDIGILKELCKFANIRVPEYKIVKYRVILPGLAGNNGVQYLAKKNGKLFASGLSSRVSLKDTYLRWDEIPHFYRQFARPVKF